MYGPKAVNDSLDLEDLISKAPVYKEELPDHAFVGVIHNMGHFLSKKMMRSFSADVPCLGLNVYAVLLFMA